VPSIPSTFKRIIQEFTFIFFSFINFFRINKPDVIIVFTTPISLGLLGSFFKWYYKCKLVINVQDFQLEAADSLGMSKQKLFFSILSKLEKYSYSKASLVTSISDSMYDLLANKKHIPLSKTYLWPNWINIDDYKFTFNHKGKFRNHNNISPDKKIIAYAGNIGLKQGLEIFIDLAKEFENENNLLFLIIGEGAAKEMLISYAADRKINNVHFLPFLNSEQYIDFLHDIDVFFLSQKKTEFDVYFPSKLLGIMAMGKLLLLSADKESELYKTISSKEIGFVSDYGNLNDLKKLLQIALFEKSETSIMIENAKKYAACFDKNIVLADAIKKIETL
jgi:colanic acid biosynthesis glycosyl transferase WcaI